MQQSGRHRRVRQVGGFTLLEMVFVLAMIAIMAGWMTLSVATVETEQKLREASGNIESLAKRARNIAVMQQRPYQLTISASKVSIAPLYVLEFEDEGFTRASLSEDEVSEGRLDDITASESTDSEVTYEIKRWRSDEWEMLEGEKRIVLTLDPAGLVEPISIRCSIGKSWMVQDLHPLTAGIRDEQMSIEKE